jgi:glycosyltransferase involved in cell wall biosynthesis
VLVAFRPQVLHINTSYYWAMPRDGLIACLAAAFGARPIMHLHGGDFREFVEGAPGWLGRFTAFALRRCGAIIVLTRETEAFVRSWLGAAGPQVRRIPNAIDPALFTGGDAAPRDGACEILFVGWVAEAKGAEDLLSALAKLPGEPAVRLTFAGPLEEGFMDRNAQILRDLGDSVRFLGAVDHSAVRTELEGADMLVLPSHREGLPIVILEAMAASLPVIATPVGAVPDVVEDGTTGLLAPVGDTDALAEKVAALAADPALRRRLGTRARETVEERFSQSIVLGDIAELYEALGGA